MPPDAGDANLSLPPDQARPPAAAPPDPGEEGTLKATQILHERGQSLWLDNITRGLLDSGQIQHYIDNYAVTGLTSNPSIFDKAIETGDYDDALREGSGTGLSDEELFLELAIEDLRRAADAFLPVHERTDGVDGWVSLEVSPLLAHDTAATIDAAKALHARVARRNLFIKIPGTAEGLPAITECIASGVPVNVTLLFSADQYRAAADAYLAGVERRLERQLDPAIESVASVFMSRWDVAVQDQVPEHLRDRLALAVGLQVYRAYRELMHSDHWQRLKNSGARMQRLLWASTSTKDPKAPDDLYLHSLGAPFTVNTVPEGTLRAFYEHEHAAKAMPPDGGDSEKTLAEFAAAGVDVEGLSAELQTNGARSFVDAWEDLMAHIEEQSAALGAVTATEGPR
jgi:transaldolase